MDSKIVLVGEAPGKTEVEQGKPFVGQAGKNLEEFITILGIREDLYITNVVKFRPIPDKLGYRQGVQQTSDQGRSKNIHRFYRKGAVGNQARASCKSREHCSPLYTEGMTKLL